MIKKIVVIGLLLAIQGTGAWAAQLPSRGTTASVENKTSAFAHWDLKRDQSYSRRAKTYRPLSRERIGAQSITDAAYDAASHAQTTAQPKPPVASNRRTAGAFDTVTIPFKKIAIRQQWLRVLAKIDGNASIACEKIGRCKPLPAALFKAEPLNHPSNLLETLRAVNTQVNRTIRYQPDSKTYGTLDYWASPDQILKAGVGDCEDYVILKFAILHKLGIPQDDLSIVVLKDTSRNLYHAVLTVQTEKGIFVLDNAQPRVLRDDRLPHYLPLYSFSGEESFIHGFRKEDKRYASANSATGIAIAPGEGPVTSRIR